MGNRSTTGLPTDGGDYQYTLTNAHPEDVGLAEGMKIPPPRESERHNSAKMGTYFRITNICWFLVLLILLLILLLVGFLADANVNPVSDWSSHGSRRYNDRHVPVSSIHKLNFDFSKPTEIIITANSTSANPSIWDGVVVFPTWDGKLIAVEEVSGDVLWSVDICIDIYGLSVPFCDDQVNQYGRYLSRSTPTIWDCNIVVSINGPADIIILNMFDGTWVSTISLTSNPFALVSQSGSIWDGQLYVGTSSNITSECFERNVNGVSDGGCTFIGTFYRVDLESATIIWATPMVNPDGVLSGDYNGFAGIPITGSTPPLSIREGLVAFNTGNLTCWPSSFETCVESSTYETVHEDCYESTSFQFALFNSVVVLRMDDGSLFWHERFFGHRTWDVSCNNNIPSNPCDGPCEFYNDRYKNCPTEEASKLDNFEYAGDPLLSTGGGGHEILYVAQNSGLIVALKLNKKTITSTNDRIEWATQVLNGSGIGGIAGDCDKIYFSVYNKNNTLWFVNSTGEAGVSGNTTCGGWGALHKSDGLPAWYIEHPKCGSTKCLDDIEQAGGYSAPTVTNDLVLVTSGDVLVDSEGDPIYITPPPYESTHGGCVYSLCADDGSVTSEFNTGAPFFQQGISLKKRCAYAGNGYIRNTNGGKFYEGTNFYLWCVNSTHSRKHPVP